MAQFTLTQEETAALRGALTSYVSDLRMEIADTDSWQWRQNLKREAMLLKKLLEQLDAAVVVRRLLVLAGRDGELDGLGGATLGGAPTAAASDDEGGCCEH